MHYQELDLVDGALEALGDDKSTATFTHDELMVTVYQSKDGGIRHVRIESIPSPHVDELRELAYQLVLTLLSETTNNDACEVLVREKSAHHEDREVGTVIVDATVEDELS